MDLHIKNMVCGRCIKTVGKLLDELAITYSALELGKVSLSEDPGPEKTAALRAALSREGFDLIDDQKAKLVEQVKNLLIDLVHYRELDELHVNLSEYISQHLHKDYNHISNLFSAYENLTIEQFFILQKIEKVKELLVYGEMTLSEIAFTLGYSSTAHLSAQFKKITGFTPSVFKQLKEHRRKALDEVGKAEPS